VIQSVGCGVQGRHPPWGQYLYGIKKSVSSTVVSVGIATQLKLVVSTETQFLSATGCDTLSVVRSNLPYFDEMLLIYRRLGYSSDIGILRFLPE
jgi:hypothetical protein